MFELPPEFQLSTTSWLFAMLAAFLIGLSKAGLKGIAVVNVTILAIVFGGKASTGIMLPLLITADICAVIYYKRDAQWLLLLKLLPWMIIGVLLGVFVGKDLPETIFKRGMAVIIFISVVMMYAWDRQKSAKVPTQWWFAGIMGLAAGFTTMIGNLAGAFSNVFFLAMRLPKTEFIGTAAWLFFIVNLIKAPFHIWVWDTISMDTFAINLRLIPVLLVGFVTGLWVVRQIQERHYRQLILILTALGAFVIFFR